MPLTERILKGIDDISPIYSHADRSPALKNFITSYEEQTKLDGTLPLLTPSTTGRELKDAYDMLEPEPALNMLVAYYNTLHKKTSGESAAAVEERKHKHWLVKFGAVTAVAGLFVVLGMVIAVSTKKGEMPNNDVIKAILSTVTDILKVIIGSSK